MQTKIITIEGIDGSGKTVQYNLLAERLEKMGFSVSRRAYPVYESYFGGQVGRYLTAADGVKATDVDQRSMALWFAMDRYFDLRDFRDGETDFLLINRYVLSNAVYQSIRDCDLGKPDIVDWVFDLEYNKLGLPRPAVNIFFDVETERAGKNVEKKGFRDYVGSGKDVYESNISIQERARHKYAEIAEKYDDTCIVCCTSDGEMLPPEAICDTVVELLRSRRLL
ncbi:MAG: hypothetical protein J1E60_04740 [Christensenellaceae bacterium]|nr:hypothetical protein [Christensenellaceae bacterium]